MDYYLLWSFLSGLLGGFLPSAWLSYKLRMLEIDLAGFETRFISEQKRKAARSRWDAEQVAAEFSNPPQLPQPKRNPLLKFGIGQKAG